MAKKADLSRQIIDAAMKRAADKGWRATTMADIAAEAKCSIGSFYTWFDNKDEVLAAVAPFMGMSEMPATGGAVSGGPIRAI